MTIMIVYMKDIKDYKMDRRMIFAEIEDIILKPGCFPTKFGKTLEL